MFWTLFLTFPLLYYGSFLLLHFVLGTFRRARRKPLIVGHRGSCALGPENKLETFRISKSLKVPMVEFDVHQSRDLKAVIIHDANLDRTTSGTGSVESYNAKDMSEKYAIPTLKELVSLAGSDLGLLVEVKAPAQYPGFEYRVLEDLKELPKNSEVVIESFDHEFLERCHRLAPRRRYAALLHPLHLTLSPPNFCEAWAPAGDLTLLLFPHLIIIAHLRRKEIWPWFVFRPLSIFFARLFLTLGCDGVIVDDPRPFLS